MPSVSEHPETLQPYLFHGVELYWRGKDKEAVGDCPWCGRSRKFSVSISTGQWRCVVCNEGDPSKSDTEIRGGNAYVFLRLLWDKSYEATATADYKALAAERGYLNDDCLIEWQLCKSILTHQWLVPGFAPSGSLMTLYAWVDNGERRLLLPTPTLGHHLHGVNCYDKRKPIVFLCEGVWDGLALYEAISVAKEVGESVAPTANKAASLLAESNVLAIAGNLVFNESWAGLFASKAVYLMAQNDHPKKHPKQGRVTPPASYMGMKRIAGILGLADPPPASIHLLHWGPEGYDPDRPSGYDIRDLLTAK